MKARQHQAYLGLGSNIGDSQNHIKQAINAIAQCQHIQLEACASLYLTKAWGNTEQQDFINTAILISTDLLPLQLLRSIQRIENDMGRVRKEKWGPRVIDIDILLYANIVVKQQHLTIPHPYITQRHFVLVPLFELNPQLIIPGQGKIEKHMHQKFEGDHIIKIF